MANNANPVHIAKQPIVFEYGTDFSLWYQQFTAYCTICNVTQANKFNSFITFLSQRAFSLINTLALTDAQKADIDAEEIKKLITNILTLHKTNIPCRIQLQHRVQNDEESLCDFMYNLEKLANSAYSGEANAVLRTTVVIDQFCIGVKDQNISIELLKNTYRTVVDTLNDAQKFASAYEIRNLKLGVKVEQSQPVEIFANTEQNNMYNNHNKYTDRYHRKVGNNSPTTSNISTRNNLPGTSKSTDTCHKCLKLGHYAYACKSDIECYACHKYGHYSFECRSRTNNNNRTYNHNRTNNYNYRGKTRNNTHQNMYNQGRTHTNKDF